MRDFEDNATVQRSEAPTGSWCDDGMQVTHIAANVQGGDLALAVLHGVVSRYQTAGDESRFIGMFAGANDVAMWRDLLLMEGQIEDGSLFLRTKL
jgi:hypothetical protein